MKPSRELNKDKIELNKKGSNNILRNLKNDFFLRLLFNNLLKKKTLEIIKYNNNIKNRINMGINDYKEYAGIYSSIEIELQIVKNQYTKFINIDEENKKY